MTRFWLWFLLCIGGIVGAFFGIGTWDSAGALAVDSGVALFLHSLFGEEA